MATTQEQSVTRNTGGNASNKRHKRTPEELDMDIEKVDQMVASGKYNQIEALNEIGLQSSVYHLRKRQWKAEPAKSLKPRKFANRTRTTAEEYAASKQELFNELAAPKRAPVNVSASKETSEMKKLQAELQELQAKYNKLQEFVVEKVILR